MGKVIGRIKLLFKKPIVTLRIIFYGYKNYFLAKKNINRLKKIKNINKGKRCVIIGNGPSLKNYDLKKIKNEDIFITNRGYFLLENGLLDKVKYYVIEDLNLHKHDKKNIENIQKKVEKSFFSHVGKNKFIKGDYIIPLFHPIFWKGINEIGYKRFSPDYGALGGGTVVLLALQIAEYMGYKDIYFLGIDLNYKKGNEHFYKNTKKEEDYSSFNLNNIEKSFNSAYKILKRDGINLYNLTKESKLKVLPIKDYNKIFDTKKNY